jgi:hypothetical protein
MAFISPSLIRISGFWNRINLRISGVSAISFGPAPASSRELEQLEEIRLSRIARVKKIENRESLLHFSGTLADALAFQARSHGLRVLSVDMQNESIQGKYVPVNHRAMETLEGLPGPQWNELTDPLDLPMFHLPSIEIQITVAADYSQVFSFIESLPDFPALVSLSGLNSTDDSVGRAFQLRIRCFYYDGGEKSEQLAQLEGAGSH